MNEQQKSKDEFLEMNGCELTVNDCAYVELDRVRKAMDEFAGQQSIGFAKWVYENEYIYDEESNRWGWNGCQDGQELKSEELYQMYIKKTI